MKISVQSQKKETLKINNLTQVAINKQQLKQVKGGNDTIIVEELIIG